MKFDNILVGGCSWCEHPFDYEGGERHRKTDAKPYSVNDAINYSFGKLLSDKFNVDYKNLAKAGDSNDITFYKLWNYINDTDLKNSKLAQEKGNIENIKEELGDVLFSIVNLSRFLNFSAEDMLRFANQKFKSRFQFIEKELQENGKKLEALNQKEIDQIWDKAKKISIENI